MSELTPRQIADADQAPRAASIGTAACMNGCPIIIFFRGDGSVMACAHINADLLEELVADLRQMRELGAAARRPPS